jgi:hypothetical protein
VGLNWVGLCAALVMALFVSELMRRGILREKFAALWLLVSGLLFVGAGFPRLLDSAASALGFALPSNLLFFASIVFLLLVSVQLSYEVSKLEARTRRLAEDLALLRAETTSSVGPARVGPPMPEEA